MASLQTFNRRTILTGLAGFGLMSGLGAPAIAGRAPRLRLSIQSIHTGEAFFEDMIVDGRVQAGPLDAFKTFARDHRDNTEHLIDPVTVTTACLIQDMMDSAEPLQLISGYRSPRTNALLRSRSSGVAKNSLHLSGRALDIRQPGRSTSALHRAAVALKRGGVGKYTSSNFVHVDSGNVRYWGS